MQLILKYFPGLNPQQTQQYERLLEIIPRLNQKVNIISRKDIEFLEERHIVHSLAIAKKFRFDGNSEVIDVGTGGGFPGLPLAVLFPETRFTLVDSIGKKIKLVQEMTEILEVKNVVAIQGRMEKLDQKADFIVSRAVTSFPTLFRWTEKLIRPGGSQVMPNGLISLKGGELDEELKPYRDQVEVFHITDWFEEPFFSTKKIVYLKK
jgi:16S rRNA (guanine527-N7)-methyltransferase